MEQSEDRKKLQSDWFEFAEGDWRGAKLLFNANASSNTIGLLIQQGIEKYLKGYLIGRGWELKKTHNIEYLIKQAINFDSRFEEYMDFGLTVTALYAEDRYPYINRQDVPMDRLKALIEEGDRLIEMVKGV